MGSETASLFGKQYTVKPLTSQVWCCISAALLSLHRTSGMPYIQDVSQLRSSNSLRLSPMATKRRQTSKEMKPGSSVFLIKPKSVCQRLLKRFSFSWMIHTFALGLKGKKDCPIYPILLQAFLQKNYFKNTKHNFLDKDFEDH